MPPFDLAAVHVRPVHPDDAQQIFTYYADPRVGRTTLSLPSAELTATLQWMKNWSPRRHRLAAVHAQRVIGTVGLRVSTHPRQPHRATIGLMVHPDFWGRGVGGTLMAAALTLADWWLNLQRVELEVFAANEAAIHLYHKFGFSIEGTSRRNLFGSGQWQDEHSMARFRDEAPPAASHYTFTGQPLAAGVRLSRAVVRPVRPTDAAGIHAVWSHPAVARQVGALPSMEIQQVGHWVAHPPAGTHRLVLAHDDAIIGLGLLTAVQRPRLQHSGRLQLMIHPDCWGSRAGARLLNALLDLADNWLNLQRLEATLLEDNAAAAALLSGAGFAPAERYRRHAFAAGRLTDSLVMTRLRDFPPVGVPLRPPPHPRSAHRPVPPADVLIRTVEADDAEDLHALMAHPLVDRTTLQLPSQEITLWEKRTQEMVDGLHRFVADVDGRAVGIISLHQAREPHRAHAAGIGMAVHPDFWGRGIGTALLDAVIDLADNWLGLQRLELGVNVDNPAAIRLYQRFGFVTEGLAAYHSYGAGRWGHAYTMARLRPDPAP